MEKINSVEINKRIDINEKIFIKISVEWCGQCKMAKLLLDKVRPNYKHITFLEIDADDNNLWDDKTFNIKQVPTFIGYNKKKIIFNVSGYQIEEKLLELLNSF